MYVISNHAIGKYDKVSFQKVANFDAKSYRSTLAMNISVAVIERNSKLVAFTLRRVDSD